MLVFQAIVEGILDGGFYALMAAGLTLVFGVMDIVNFAQGILIVLGAYGAYYLNSHLHMDPFLATIITAPLMFGLGYVIYYTLIKPIKGERVVMALLTMYAVAQVIEGLINVVSTGTLVQINTSYVNDSFKFIGIRWQVASLLSFALSAVVLAALYFMLYRTRLGRALRASMQNPVAARLVGIDIDRVSAITLGIGVGIAAIGGAMFGLTNSFNASSSYDLISRLLVIVILGGFGSIGGALAASVVMLVIIDVVSVVWSPVWGSTMFYLVLIVVLLVRPQGLFGKKGVRAQ